MYFGTLPDHTPQLPPQVRWRLHLLCLTIVILALSVTAIGALRLIQEIGEPFGGFFWVPDGRNRPVVMPDAPYYWPGFTAGLRPWDTLLSVDGQPASQLSHVYDAQAGRMVKYEVQRGGQRLVVRGPVVRFTRRMWIEAFGPRLLAGLITLLVAYLLFRSAHEPFLVLVSLALLLIGALLVNHVNGPMVHRYRPAPLISMLLWSYGFPFIAALLWHLSLLFPRPKRVLRRHARWVYPLLYGLALVIGSVYFVSIHPDLGLRWMERWTSPLFLGALASGGIVSIVNGFWAYIAPPVGREDPERPRIRMLATAWVLAVLLYGYIGIGRSLITAPWAMVLLNITDSGAVVYPLVLLYAIRGVQLLGRLQQQVAVAERMADELREMRGIRERTLHEIADALHDTVVADVRGLQLWLAGMRLQYDHRRASAERQASAEGVHIAPGELAFLEKTLKKVYHDARRIMEGAKPVDFAAEGLLKPLQRSLTHFRQANPGLEVHLDVGPYDEAYPTFIKEEVYWIVQTALANSRDHAGARRIEITLRKEGDRLSVRVRDDGRGFDLEEVLREEATGTRRRLGLRNMQARADRIGAELEIDPGPQGTEVRVEVALRNAE